VAAVNPANAFKALEASGGTGSNAIAAGAVGLGLFYAFWSWVGFEMAPNYGEESRDPKRNVPRSLYISVIGLGIFYIITSWAPFAGYSTVNAAVHQAQKDPLQYYFLPANSVAGHWVGSVLSYLIITGSFARDEVPQHSRQVRLLNGPRGPAPRALGRTHPGTRPVHRIARPDCCRRPDRDRFWISPVRRPHEPAYYQVYGLMALMGVMSSCLCRRLSRSASSSTSSGITS
jgi:L-asparagine transporter-like permease